MMLSRWFKKRPPQPTMPTIISAISGLQTIISAMREKDPDTYERIAMLPPGAAMRGWKESHPEDFPKGGMTIVTDPDDVRNAIQPKAREVTK